MSIEVMKQALEALKLAKSSHGVILTSYPAQDAWVFHGVDKRCFDAITALRQAIEEAEKQQALDKKADNARELGLNYEPAHTDHPMRHWDRTCPACVAEQEPVAYIDRVSGKPKFIDGYVVQTDYDIPLYTAPPKRDMSTKQENVYTSAERVQKSDESIHEPKAWIYNGNLHIFDPSYWAEYEVTPLYTALPRKEWVGLTELEIKHYNSRLSGSGVAQEIESRLRERNT